MRTWIWDDLPFAVQYDTVAKALKMDQDEDMAEEFREIYDKCMALAHPRMIWGEAEAETTGPRTTMVAGRELTSRILRVNFEDVKTCWPYVCTSGRELYEYSLANAGDPLTRFWIDTVAERVLHSALTRATERVREMTGGDTLYAMNPGSLADWPLIGQRPLFAMLGDVKDAIGVELTESCLMLPVKSVSGILFHSESHYVNCALCPREGCTGRRAPFDENMFAEKYGM